MCGRYALSLRPSNVRQRLADQNMPADDAPSDDDDQVRQTYNFAPGNHGLIYRAETSERGADPTPHNDEPEKDANDEDGEPAPKRAKLSHAPAHDAPIDGLATRETKYKLQSAKWGLIPFWTKRPPDYGSMMRTINCRDDSLLENRGMWNTMKQRKRCIVVAEGFYEWLKTNGGKEKLPHYVKRKDGALMCFAGLWDAVQYEGSEERLYTYTVITTDSNRQLKFLHNRMPVLLEPGSEGMRAWLDPKRVGWDKELQGLLKPFDGELECYQVDKAVGKVGNNSPTFVVPLDSKENKNNIANFFGSQSSPKKQQQPEVKREENEPRETTVKLEDPESNAPLPKPPNSSEESISDSALVQAADEQTSQNIKREVSDIPDSQLLKAEAKPKSSTLLEKEAKTPSPSKKSTAKATRDATSNGGVAKTPTKGKEQGNMKIENFFKK